MRDSWASVWALGKINSYKQRQSDKNTAWKLQDTMVKIPVRRTKVRPSQWAKPGLKVRGRPTSDPKGTLSSSKKSKTKQAPNSLWPALYPTTTGTQEKPVREFPWASPHLLIPTFKSHLSPQPWTAQPPKEPQFCGGTDRRVQTGRCWHCKYLLQVMLWLELQLLGETNF